MWVLLLTVHNRAEKDPLDNNKGSEKYAKGWNGRISWNRRISMNWRIQSKEERGKKQSPRK
jgi:hypothetical protein